MSRFPRKHVAAVVAVAALAASATHLTAQTKQAKSVADQQLDPLSAERTSQAQPLEYERATGIQPGAVEHSIAKTVSPKDQPLESGAAASATTRLEQGTGTLEAATEAAESAAGAEPRSDTTLAMPDAELPAAPLAEYEYRAEPTAELPAAPKPAAAKPERVPASAIAPPSPAVPTETLSQPAAVAPESEPVTATTPPELQADATAELRPISISRSFGRIVKAKGEPAPAAVAAIAPTRTASIGINPRGRRLGATATDAGIVPEPATSAAAMDLGAMLEPTALNLAIDGTATSAALLAGTEAAGSPLVAQRSASRRSVNQPWSYISLGGNFGFNDGRTELSDTAFAIGSKIGLTPYLSVRPMALLGNRATFLIPVTYDLAISNNDPFEPSTFIPYVGGGLLVTTNDGNNIGPLVSGGVDIRLSESIVLNTGINAAFLRDDTDIGLTIGIGYIFPTGF